MQLAIVKLSALGDIVHAMVALQFIKAARPDIAIDWLVEARFADVLAHNPHIRHIHTVNLKALKTNKRAVFSQWHTLQGYAQQRYDCVIDAQGLIKSALVARLLSRRCVGFDRHSIREKLAAYCYQQTVAYPYDANTIDRNVAVLTRPLGIEVSSQQILDKQPFLFFQPPQQALEVFFSGSRPTVLLVVGSTWPSRNYPKEQWLQLIEALDAQCLVSWGNAEEQHTAQWLAQRSTAQVLPRLSLNDLKAVIARVDLLIGNDTGPTHMAWGLNRPSITLFGPTPVSRVYQTPINRALKSPSAVNPFKLNKHDFSISQIAVSAIVAEAQCLLTRPS